MSNKKYLLFTLEYPPFKGGVSRYYENLVKYWEGDILVLADKKEKPLVSDHIWPRWLPAFWQLFKVIKKEGIGHVIVGHILPLGTVCYFLSKILKFKYSVILHGMDFAYALKLPRKKEITRKILTSSHKIICGNSYTANLVKTFLGREEKKISVVNPGIELNFIRNPDKVREFKAKYNLDGKLVLFSLGRLTKRKGFDKVIEIIPRALSQIPNLVYVIAGAGEEEKNLKEEASRPGKKVGEKIIFLGKISDEDHWAWLEVCDIFIMPSRDISGDFEGFGIVYLEANLVGRPVIAGDSGGVRDAVIDKVNGLLVNPEDNSDILKAVVNLAQNKTLRHELGEQGKRRTVENFSSKKQIKKIKDIITS